VRKTQFEPRGLHLGKELVFAMETALRVVANIFGLVELGRLQDARRDTMLRREVEGGGKLLSRQRRRVRDDCEHAVAKDAMRGVGEKG